MTKEETIQVLKSIEARAADFPNMTECDWVAIASAKRHLENSLEVKEEPVSMWHNMDEVPIKGEVIVVQTKDTFYGLSVQKGGSTYKNRNKDRYVRWAYASDLLNLSNVQRTVKSWEEPISEDLKEEIHRYYAEENKIMANERRHLCYECIFLTSDVIGRWRCIRPDGTGNYKAHPYVGACSEHFKPKSKNENKIEE